LTQGLSCTRLYSIYSGMKQRCYNSNNPNYKHYGGKGITICDEWMNENGIQNFISWALNNGYNEHLTIDRIDNNAGYSPQNCHWVTRSQNSQKVFLDKPNATFSSKKFYGLNYKKLFAFMNKYNITAHDFINLTGLSFDVLTQLINGDALTTDNIEVICKTFCLQPSDIMECTFTEHEKKASDVFSIHLSAKGAGQMEFTDSMIENTNLTALQSDYALRRFIFALYGRESLNKLLEVSRQHSQPQETNT